MAYPFPPAASRARVRRIAVLAAAVFVLLTLLRGLPAFAVEYLWFREVGYLHVFLTRLWAQAGLQLLFGAAFFAFLLGNLLLALRRLPPNLASLHEMRALLPAVVQILPVLPMYSFDS